MLGSGNRTALRDFNAVADAGLILRIMHMQDGALAHVLAVLGVLETYWIVTLRVFSREAVSTIPMRC